MKKEKNQNINTRDYSLILKNPRITEKATMLSENKAYVFDVIPSATKIDIKKAIEKIYKVKPVKIGIVNYPAKEVFKRGKKGIKGGGKKAIVYLKEEDKIEII